MNESGRTYRSTMEQRTTSVVWGLRFRTLLLVLLAVVPALFLLAGTAGRQRRLVAEQVEESNLRLARLVASDLYARVQSARELLVTLAEVPAVRSRDAAACTGIAKRLLEKNPAYSNIGMVTPDGRIFASALKLPGVVSVADRSYFQRALKTRNFAVGDFQVGRVTREETINFAYPVMATDGRVEAVVYVALRLNWIAESTVWNLPEDTTMTIVDDTGMVLIHYPDPARWVGRRVNQLPAFQPVLSQPEGKAIGSGLDGERRAIAFTRMRSPASGRQISVVLGVPVEAVENQLRGIYGRALLGMFFVSALALIAAWVGGDLFFLRQVKALVRAARRIRSGDLTARTGVHYGRDELSSLTYAFDSMADSLENLTGRQELILSSAGEGIYGVNREGRMTFVNPAAARMLGFETSELIGYPNHELFHHSRIDGTPYPREECPVVRAYREGEVCRADDEVFWRKDGTSFPVDYVATPAREHGEIVGAVVVFRDITQRKDAEQKVARAQEEILQAALEKKRFYREVIRSVTKDKLHLVDPGDIPVEGTLLAEGELESEGSDRAARRCVRSLAEQNGLSPDRCRELILAVGEATTNAVKHATQGRYTVHRAPDRLIVRVSDRGAGIETENLPATLFQTGYSTKVSMGMGYTLMLELSDRVWLSTGPAGTILQLEKWIEPAERPKSPLSTALERM